MSRLHILHVVIMTTALSLTAVVTLACMLTPPATEVVVTISVDPILPTVIPTPVPDPDVDEGRLVQLTRAYDSDRNPSYSPLGDKVVFECYDDGWLWNQPSSRYHIPGDGREITNWPISSYYIPGDICVMNADGTGRVQLTDDQGDDSDPAWSPDGNQIIFSSCREDGCNIYVMNADGSGLNRITDDEFHEGHPTWSPDGTRIAFSSSRDGSSAIYVMNADGSNLTRVVESRGEVQGSYFEPAWSPDGNRIAFTGRWPSTSRKSYSGIFVVNHDGTEQTLLYGRYGDAGSPAWSSDSKTIAFAADVQRDSWFHGNEIHIINVDGSGLERLTYRRGYDLTPTWSPDGSKLAFVSAMQGNPDIYELVDFQTHLQRLTDNTHADTAPAWSPDGTRIAFVSDRGGDDEIYIMNADGSGVVQLTDDVHARNYGPVWSPDGSQIAYQSDDLETDEAHYDIFVINQDGSGNIKLTSEDVFAIIRLNGALSWSPVGTRIAYVSDSGGQYQGFVMNSDGTNQVKLNVEDCQSYAVAEGFRPQWSYDDTGIAWSPDGTQLAMSCRDSNLRIVNPSDGTQSSFYACSDPVSAPEWSSDGTRIMFICGFSGRNDIYVIDIGDDDATPFTDGDSSAPRLSLSPLATSVIVDEDDDTDPTWSPDETKVAFATDRDGDYEIYILDLTRAP